VEGREGPGAAKAAGWRNSNGDARDDNDDVD
jgi:hypothetical protein